MVKQSEDARKAKKELSNILFTSNECLMNADRTVILSGELNSTSVVKMYEKILLLGTRGAMHICISISSLGEDDGIRSAIALYDFIMSLNCPIYTYLFNNTNSSKVNSVNTLLLFAGDFRSVGRHTSVTMPGDDGIKEFTDKFANAIDLGREAIADLIIQHLLDDDYTTYNITIPFKDNAKFNTEKN